MKDLAKAILYGVAVGDALGVPVEFKARWELVSKPVTDMRGYGTYNQPPGTWSDDSSLTFCTAKAIIDGFSLEGAARLFIYWKQDAHYTPEGYVFDIGITTSGAINRLKRILNDGDLEELLQLKYDTDEHNNGNGSLMRILPMLIEVGPGKVLASFDLIRDTSALTHWHIRAAIACTYYLFYCDKLIELKDKEQAYQQCNSEFRQFFIDNGIDEYETSKFDRLLSGNIATLPVNEIRSTGYVMHTLEAAMWCFLNTDTYASCVLKAVNLGEDTDTTAAVAGGIAGLYYGYENIPEEWRKQIARPELIEKLAAGLQDIADTKWL